MSAWEGGWRARGSATRYPRNVATPTPSDRGPHAPSNIVKFRAHTDIKLYSRRVTYITHGLLDPSSNDNMQGAGRI
jgi:hypothetical protein